MSGTREFYTDLFRGYREPGFIEIRSLSQPDEAGRRGREVDWFTSVAGFLAALPRIIKNNLERRWATYYGVLPRQRKAGDKSALRSASVVWVDIDMKDVGSKDDCLGLLNPSNQLVPLPSYVIDSGNGLHAYWLLDTEVYDLDAIEAINRGLAEATKADACHNRDRILRVPGSWNTKGGELKKADIIRATEFRYELDRFKRFFGRGEELLIRRSEISLREEAIPYGLIDELPDFIRLLVVHGIDGDRNNRYGGDRSRMDFFVACKLIEEGFTPGQVLSIFTNYGFGISEKTRQAGVRYVENTIKNAVNAVERRGLEVCHGR